MSNDKKYTAEEVARMVADRAAEVMKKHEVSSEYFEQILQKSKNKAHEIDSGEEPNNDDAECPPSLCESGESEKSESSESASMEDQPLQGDKDSDTEKEENEKDKDKEDKEDEYEFKKSEACGHVIEYKRLAKRCWEGYEPTPGKKAYEKGSCQKKNEEEVEKCGDMKKEEDGEMSVGKAVAMIMSDKHGVDDVMDKVPAEMRSKVMAALRNKDAKKAEMCKGYMDKCGDMSVAKSESGMHTVEYKRLAKGYMQKAKVDEGMSAGKKHKMREERNKDFKPHQKEKFTADGLKQFKLEDPAKQSKLKQKLQEKHPKMPSKDHLEYPMAASEDGEDGKENPSFDREKKDVEWTGNQKKMIDRTKPGSKPSSRKDQAKFIAEAKERRKKMRAEGLFNSEKEEMDKCGDMTSGKKLKKFMSKKSQK